MELPVIVLTLCALELCVVAEPYHTVIFGPISSGHKVPHLSTCTIAVVIFPFCAMHVHTL